MQAKAIELVWITVKDFKSAVRFYTDVAGLKLVQIHEEWGWAELEGFDGGARLGIAQQNPNGQEDYFEPGRNAILTVVVENLERANKDVSKKGAQLIGDIQEVPGHVKLQTVRDHEGNYFQLVEKIHEPQSADKEWEASHI